MIDIILSGIATFSATAIIFLVIYLDILKKVMLVNKVTQHRKFLLCSFSPQGPQVSSPTFFFRYLLLSFSEKWPHLCHKT